MKILCHSSRLRTQVTLWITLLMQHYMFQGSFTPEAWSKLLDKPKGRLEMLLTSVEKLGGKVENVWLCFGEYDFIVICSLPGNVSSAAFSMAATACGALKASKTTPLLAPEEGLAAMEKAYMEKPPFLF